MIRNLMLAVASIALLSIPALAAPCRDAKGKFIKGTAAAPAKATRCKGVSGKFAMCGMAGCAPLFPAKARRAITSSRIWRASAPTPSMPPPPMSPSPAPAKGPRSTPTAGPSSPRRSGCATARRSGDQRDDGARAAGIDWLTVPRPGFGY